jgi:elongation factor 4
MLTPAFYFINVIDFSIIAHIDHGKSTLADCLLQLAGNITADERKQGQVLDTLQVERERGITVKAQTASMIFKDARSGIDYLINLIDTPGHIDFSYEVSRSLATCQGALLLVDSSQRIQAQTLANHEKARLLGLKMIPVVTKIDLPNAQPEEAALNMGTTFDLDPEECIMTSAKQNIGIIDVMRAVVDRLPSPVAALMDRTGPFYGRIVDSWFDTNRGVVCLVQVVGGTLREGQRIAAFASKEESKEIDNRTDFSVQEIGILTPKALRTSSLRTGQVFFFVYTYKPNR